MKKFLSGATILVLCLTLLFSLVACGDKGGSGSGGGVTPASPQYSGGGTASVVTAVDVSVLDDDAIAEYFVSGTQQTVSNVTDADVTAYKSTLTSGGYTRINFGGSASSDGADATVDVYYKGDTVVYLAVATINNAKTLSILTVVYTAGTVQTYLLDDLGGSDNPGGDQDGGNPGSNPGGDQGGGDSTPTYTRKTSVASSFVKTYYGATQNLVVGATGTLAVGSNTYDMYNDEDGYLFVKVGNNYKQITLNSNTMSYDDVSYYAEKNGCIPMFDSSSIAGSYENDDNVVVEITSTGSFKAATLTFTIWKNRTSGALHIEGYYSSSDITISNASPAVLTWEDDTYTKTAPWTRVSSTPTGMAKYYEYVSSSTCHYVDISADGSVSFNGVGYTLYTRAANEYAIFFNSTYLPVTFGASYASITVDDDVYTASTRWTTLTAAPAGMVGTYEYSGVTMVVNANASVSYYNGAVTYTLCERDGAYALLYSGTYTTITYASNTITLQGTAYVKSA